MRLLIAAAAVVALALPAQAQTVSRDRLMADVVALSADAMQGRGLGTEGGRLAREHIVAEFEAAGLEPLTGAWLLPFTAGAGASRPTALQGFNIAGVARGTVEPDRYIVVTAHYDHEGVAGGQIYNGADDNASGTAALLELARLLRDHPPRHSVILLALDGEEHGLLGARAFVADPPVPPSSMILNVNLDMIARGDNGILWAVGTRQYPALIPIIDALPQQPGVERRYGYDDPSAPGRDNWINLSDQAAFHARGVPFVFFSVDDHPDYHQPTDDADRIDPAWYGGAVQIAVDTVLAVDALDAPNFRRAGKPGNF